MKNYDHKKIEQKWQEIWSKTGLLKTDLSSKKPKHYNLVMFPYPSGDYLHLGHGYSYSGADVYARYKKLNGFEVFEPIGFDSFGLPAENFAIKKGVHPQESTAANIEHAQSQLKSFGCLFDPEHQVITSDPNYYKWTQWLFLKLYKQGLAYQKESPVNWCPKCLTVLANEQVINGICERCDTEVVQKNMKQWFFKTTDYAERLIDDLDKVDWPESSVIKQRNWIGKSEGVEMDMAIDGSGEKITVFTTRIDTVFGMTYVVLAPEHPVATKITTKENEDAVKKYQAQAKKKSDLERQEEKEKTGVFTGAYAVNPFNGEKVPVWVADYVLGSYGTGAVMAVPAHDERDFEFAKNFDLPIKHVITRSEAAKQSKIATPSARDDKKEIFTNYGMLENSEEFSGLASADAKKKMAEWLEKEGIGKKKVNYRLRDWSFSRQRYWGAPIPVIYCEKCGVVLVSEKNLPVELPVLDIEQVRPTGTGRGPLANVPEFVNTSCPKCGGKAERETDTMDTFVCSSFYFMRYPSVGDNSEMMDPKITKKWLPVDMYVGGAEHVTMHLLYARFVTKALFDAGLIDFDEPFAKLRHQGMILGPDGKKMSKSKGNVIVPNEIIAEEGADAFRTYILFMGPFEDGGPWNPKGLAGIQRFLTKVWGLYQGEISDAEPAPAERVLLNKTIKKVGEDISEFHFNTAISSLMILVNELVKNKSQSRQSLGSLALMLAPFAPFMAEELWETLGEKESVHVASWPSYDEKMLEDDIAIIVVQVNGKVRANIEMSKDSTQEEVEKTALENEHVLKFTEGKKPRKVIYIPGKILNIVV